MSKSNKKTGRNELCPCGSGKKFKYCHYGYDRGIPVAPENNPLGLNKQGQELSNLIFSLIANENLPLFEFCLESGIYYFQGMSIDAHIKKLEALRAGNLDTDALFESWKDGYSREYLERMLKNDQNREGFLGKNKDAVSQIIEAHFSGLYTLTIPTCFALIEGIFRDYGNVSFDRNNSPVYRIDSKGLKEGMLYGDLDAIKYFCKFLNKIMSGKSEVGDFHRNTVMHGVSKDYSVHDNSLLLIMTLFEFARLEGLSDMWPPSYSQIGDDWYCNGYKIEMRSDI